MGVPPFLNLFPFTQLNNYELFSLFCDKSFSDTDSNVNCLIVKPPKNLQHLCNEFNSFMLNPNNNLENFVNCKYYDINQVQNLKTFDDNKSLFLLHFSTCSLFKELWWFSTPFPNSKYRFWCFCYFYAKDTEKVFIEHKRKMK